MKRWIVMLLVGVTVAAAGCAGGTTGNLEQSVAPTPDVPAGAPTVERGVDMSGDLAETAVTDRKIIENASVDLEVADPEASAKVVERLAKEAGGFVSNENIYRSTAGTKEATYANIQVRIPASELTSFLDRLEAEAIDVRSRNVSSQDITEEYSDIEAQLRNLRAYEDELRSLLGEVRDRPDAKPQDLLDVFENIRQVRGEIEQLEGRQRLYDSLVAMATVDVTLTPSEAVEPLAPEGWDAGSILRRAVRGLVAALQAIASAAIWLVVFLVPVLLVIFVPLGLVAWLIVRAVRRRKERDAETSEVMEQ